MQEFGNEENVDEIVINEAEIEGEKIIYDKDGNEVVTISTSDLVEELTDEEAEESEGGASRIYKWITITMKGASYAYRWSGYRMTNISYTSNGLIKATQQSEGLLIRRNSTGKKGTAYVNCYAIHKKKGTSYRLKFTVNVK